MNIKGGFNGAVQLNIDLRELTITKLKDCFDNLYTALHKFQGRCFI